jgi:hypothetical protein
MYVCHFCTFVRNVGCSFFHPSDDVNDVTITEFTHIKFHSQLVCDVLQETNFYGLLVCSLLLYRCDIGCIHSKHGLQALQYADDQVENFLHIQQQFCHSFSLIQINSILKFICSIICDICAVADNIF